MNMREATCHEMFTLGVLQSIPQYSLRRAIRGVREPDACKDLGSLMWHVPSCSQETPSYVAIKAGSITVEQEARFNFHSN